MSETTLLNLLIQFIEQSHTENHSTKEYPDNFQGLKCKISFGRSQAYVPWICFPKEGMHIQQGYYPGFYYDRNNAILFLVFGISEEKPPAHSWPQETLAKYPSFESLKDSPAVAQKYPHSHKFARYDIDPESISSSLQDQISHIEEDFASIVELYSSTSDRVPLFGDLSFSTILQIFITRFKERYDELEKITSIDGMTGTQRRQWLKEQVQSAFSRENISTLKNEEAIGIIKQFYSIYYGSGPGDTSKSSEQWARGIVEDGGLIQKARDLLYGDDPFEERYMRFTEIGGVKHGITSEFLCYWNPDEYGICYGSSEKALHYLGMGNITIPKSGKRNGEYYLAFNQELKKVLAELKKDEFFKDADLSTLDYFFYEISSLSFWQIAPGPAAGYWDEFHNGGIIGIFYEEYLSEAKPDWLLLDKEELEGKFKSVYPDATKKATDLIHKFTRKVRPGDLIVANRGNEAIMGWGIVASAPSIHPQRNNEDYTVVRDVRWIEGVERPIPEDFKRAFMTTILQLKESEFLQLIHSETPHDDTITDSEQDETLPERDDMPMDPLKQLLERKKQVILYGPPGTGKTHRAIEFVKSNALESTRRQKTSFERKFFWLSVNKKKYDPDRIFTNAESASWQGRLKSAFESIDEGDYIFVYGANPLRKILGIAECQSTFVDTDGIPKITITGIQKIDGPDWATLKEDEIVSGSAPIRNGAQGTLFPLSDTEAEQILALSGLNPGDLAIAKTTEYEHIENRNVVTFHPSFGYEDFIEGLRPIATEDGTLTYCVEEGVFKEFSRQALNALLSAAGIEKEWTDSGDLPRLDKSEKELLRARAPDVPFYLIIDEINRGDIARIFGELITLLEADKRFCEEYEIITTLPYSKKKFAVPPNLFIIGTMNTADKSIALVDIALRRRFGFVEMMPDYDVLTRVIGSMDPTLKEVSDIAVPLLQTLNERILASYDRDHQIGHSYFTRLNNAHSHEEAVDILHFAWYNDIIPLLQEYYYDSPKKLYEVIGKRFVTLSQDERSFTHKGVLYGAEFIDAITELAGGNREPEITDVDE
jgi:5-methylcytosine-specific restriction protein B